MFHPIHLRTPLATMFLQSGDPAAARLLHHLVRAAQSENLPESPQDVSGVFLNTIVSQLKRWPRAAEGLEGLLEVSLDADVLVVNFFAMRVTRATR